MNEKVKQAIEIVIEEYANVDEAFQNIKNIKVGSMTLNDLFGNNLKVIENALKERKELLKWKDSQKDLIKGKDEYIAKLCNDRAELKEYEKELIAEQHRLFDLAKEQENELKELKEFVKIVGRDFYTEYRGQVLIINGNSFPVNKEQIDFLMKVARKYAKEE